MLIIHTFHLKRVFLFIHSLHRHVSKHNDHDNGGLITTQLLCKPIPELSSNVTISIPNTGTNFCIRIKSSPVPCFYVIMPLNDDCCGRSKFIIQGQHM